MSTTARNEAKYYRFDSMLSGTWDSDGERLLSTKVQVCLRTYNVLRETPKGVWLDVYGLKRFVRSDTRKRFAWPTIEEARESFRARKRRQIKILKKQLENALEALEVLKSEGEI